MGLCCWTLAAAEFAAPGAAYARAPGIDLPAGTLPQSLTLLSRQTGISIGFEGNLPPRRTPAVRGSMSPAQALDRLLRGSGLVARQLGPAAFRLERLPMARPAPAPNPRLEPAPRPSLVAGDDIVVTAAKREEPLSSLPIAISVVHAPGEEGQHLLPSTLELARDLDGLTLTNLGPGRNRAFIRGIADSPFNGNSQSTVAVLLNDARVTYSAPDPDLRLVDVDRVELLKGPQGTLYGTGALGGVLHIVTRPPDPGDLGGAISASGSLLTHGAAGGDVQAIANVPLLAEKLAVRIVAYGARDAGWIEAGDRRNINHNDVAGGRLALRAVLGDWSVDLLGAAQSQNVADSQYVFAADRRSRPAQLPEPNEADLFLGAVRIGGKLGSVDLSLATNLVSHEVSSRLDASTVAASVGLSGPVAYEEPRRNRLLDHELRLSDAGAGYSWLVGLSYLDAHNVTNGAFVDATGLRVGAASTDQLAQEAALFGDVRIDLSDRLNLSVGGRLFHSRIEEERAGREDRGDVLRRRTGITPSLGLAWHLDERDMLFARYASALRPGGLSQDVSGTIQQFRSDELQTAEVGWRRNGHRLKLSLNGYATNWSHVQSDYILPSGLIGTRNVGTARIYGGELSVDWNFASQWSLVAGGVLQSALLSKPAQGFVASDDRRLPTIPGITGRLALARSIAIGPWDGKVRGTVNYVGHARLSFDPGLDRSMGNYALLGLDASMKRGAWTFGLSVDNLLDSSADSFAYGNPFLLSTMRQFTPLRPREASLSVGLSW